MKKSIQTALAIVLCAVMCTLSACDDDDTILVDYTGTYHKLVKAKDNAFAIEEKEGEFHVNVPAQGGTYEFEFNPGAYYVVHDGKEKKVKLEQFNFIMRNCFDEAVNNPDFWTEDNPYTEDNLLNFKTENHHPTATSLDCFFGRFEGLLNRCVVSVNPNDQKRDRNLRIVFSTFPAPEAHIVLHQAAE